MFFYFYMTKERKKTYINFQFAYLRQSPIFNYEKRKKRRPCLNVGEVYFVKLQNWINE